MFFEAVSVFSWTLLDKYFCNKKQKNFYYE